jgi:hypothetical protein
MVRIKPSKEVVDDKKDGQVQGSATKLHLEHADIEL